MTAADSADASRPRALSPFQRRLLEFGVWFGVGIAPFLGYAKIRGFTAVIEMYPLTLQRWLIPLSGLFMGTIAVVVDFAQERRIGKRVLTRWFVRTIATFVVSLILLIGLYLLTVTTIEQSVRRPDGEIDHGTHAVVTARTTVPPVVSKSCGCAPGDDAEQCIAGMSLEPRNVKACFGGTPIAFASIALALVYLALTGSFAAAVGLLVLAQRRNRARA